MATYLIHQLRDGTPIGIFSEIEVYYLPQYAPTYQAYGQAVIDSKGTETSWTDWAEQQASKTPGTKGMWDVIEAPYGPLSPLLDTVRRNLVVS